MYVFLILLYGCFFPTSTLPVDQQRESGSLQRGWSHRFTPGNPARFPSLPSFIALSLFFSVVVRLHQLNEE